VGLGGWGLGALIGIPVLAVLLLVSILGAPLGLSLLLGLALLLFTGFALSAWIVGRLLWRPPRSRWLALLFGWLIASAATAIPYAGGVIVVAGSGFGLGAAMVATWRARRTTGAASRRLPPAPLPRRHRRRPRPSRRGDTTVRRGGGALMEAAEKLRAIPLFAGLDDEALGHVADLFSEVEAPEGQVIVEHGHAGSGMFLLEEGPWRSSCRAGRSSSGRRVLRRAVDPCRRHPADRPRADDDADPRVGHRSRGLRARSRGAAAVAVAMLRVLAHRLAETLGA